MIKKQPERSRPQLTPTEQLILECVIANSGVLTRSGLAKLLVGSTSRRLGEMEDNPFYGRFRQHTRKSITHEIDVLLQQGYLALNWEGKIVPDEDR